MAILFLLVRSLWPLLTGPIPRHRRPRLADGFYSSRPLWLRPLLAWVSEPWLPVAAREAAAGFVQRSLLPFLCVLSSSSSSSSPSALSPVVSSSEAARSSGSSGSSGSSPRAKSGKKVRLVGNRFRVVEDEQEDGDEEEKVDPGVGGGGRLLGRNACGPDEERKEESAILHSLRSAAAAVAGVGVGVSSPAQGPPPTSPVGGSGGDRLDPAAPTNPFARPAERPGGGSSGAADGSSWLQMPWERRLGTGSAASRLAPAGVAGPEPSFEQINFTRVSGAAAPPLTSSAVNRASRHGRGSAAEPEAVAVGREEPRFGGARTGFSGAVGAAATPDGAHTGGKRSVTAAEAAAARSLRAHTSAAAAAAAVKAGNAAVSRPRGSVVERWREMQRKQMAESGTAPYSDSAKSRTNTQEQQQRQQADRRSQTRTGRGDTARDAVATRMASNSTEAKAAFTAAARAAAGRADGAPDGGARAPNGGPAATAAAALDPAALTKASSMELHRLVLSSWTVSELLDAQRQGRGGGSGFRGAGDGGRDRRLLSSLWLSKVCVWRCKIGCCMFKKTIDWHERLVLTRFLPSLELLRAPLCLKEFGLGHLV